MTFKHDGWGDAGAGKDELDARLTRALEAAPAVRVPEGFAARVAEQAPDRRAAVEGGRVSVGRGVAFAGAGCLLAAVVVLVATGEGHGHLWLTVGLDVEFAALTVWLTLRPRLEL